jgi:hypothetical protein
MLLALLVCLVIYLAISVPDRWFPSVAPRAFTAPELSLARGTGRLVGDELRGGRGRSSRRHPDIARPLI